MLAENNETTQEGDSMDSYDFVVLLSVAGWCATGALIGSFAPYWLVYAIIMFVTWLSVGICLGWFKNGAN